MEVQKMNKINSVDMEFIEYLWKQIPIHNLERWVHWTEERKFPLRKKYPEVVKALDAFKVAEQNLSTAFELLKRG